MKYSEDDKQALIELIEWYRDEWHRSDWCHSEWIETIRATDDEEEIALIERAVDDWADY